MNKIKKELELLKSWRFETVSIDKVLEMIEQADDTEVESDEKMSSTSSILHMSRRREWRSIFGGSQCMLIQIGPIQDQVPRDSRYLNQLFGLVKL